MKKLFKNILCIYHKNCADGFGALTAVHHYCKNNDISLETHSAHYGDEAPDVTDKDVLIVDFSYPRETLEQMHKQANFLHVIDHHKTAQDALKGLNYCTFDMEKSGAVLTWNYLFNKPTPLFLLYIQDRDLWRWELENSREISAAIQAMDMELEIWEQFLDNNEVPELIIKGEAILEYQNKTIKKITNSNIPTENIAGFTVPCINSTTLISEIGNELSKKQPFAAMYFETSDKRIYSLRSQPEGEDVSEIAKLFGGGGHKNAAGFSMDKPKQPQLLSNPAQNSRN